MRGPRIALFAAAVLLAGAGGSSDPLAVELARWSAFLESLGAREETWAQMKPGLARAEQALRAGHRFLALLRFAAVRADLEATAYVIAHGAERKDQALFEAEWKRVGESLRTSPPPRALPDLQPAAIRAIAEAALPQVQIYYDASLDYSRSTAPEFGLFFLGAAKAQRGSVDFTRSLGEKTSRRPPPLRSLGSELDALERDLLAAYRPPASIDRHAEFIGASAMLKEARELDAAGLRYGALLRYLETARRVGQIRGTALPRDEVTRLIRDFSARLDAEDFDHTIARIYLEAAQSDLETPPESGPAVATAVATYVLPRYFAAIGPGGRRPPPQAPRATVTLVRWPYT